MLNIDISAIITAIGTIIIGWFSYNQYTKNKLTDEKIEQWKKDEETKSIQRSEDLAKIYGELWRLLHTLGADRVFIVQPHPLANNLYVSIALECKRSGISSMKSVVDRLPIADIASFAADLATREFLFYRDTSSIKDDRARAICSINGTSMAAIRRLSDCKYDWLGSIFVEFAHATDTPVIDFKNEMSAAADAIRYLLPEFREHS